MQHSEEALGELVIAGRDRPVDLQVAEHALDAVAVPIQALVPADRGRAMRPRRNDRADAAPLEIGTDRVGVVTLVAKQRCGHLLGQIDQDFVRSSCNLPPRRP